LTTIRPASGPHGGMNFHVYIARNFRGDGRERR